MASSSEDFLAGLEDNGPLGFTSGAGDYISAGADDMDEAVTSSPSEPKYSTTQARAGLGLR